uniref:Uncharacterized protein n=1 Tax=Aegilops tauschii subsp. strangulata TaxID=200361 RepID=A0A453FQC9_AEGTS
MDGRRASQVNLLSGRDGRDALSSASQCSWDRSQPRVMDPYNHMQRPGKGKAYKTRRRLRTTTPSIRARDHPEGPRFDSLSERSPALF